MAMNIQLLVFRNCKHDGVKSYECASAGGGLNNEPLAVHCLLHHGLERFDALEVADPSKHEEVCRGLIKMGHAHFKKALEYSESLQFADVDDDQKMTSGACVFTVVDTDEDAEEEEEDDDDEESELPDPSQFAARMLLMLGASTSGSGGTSSTIATPVRVASAASAPAHLTTVKPRTLTMQNDAVGITQGSGVPGDDDTAPLAQNAASSRESDERDRKGSTRLVEATAGTAHETLCGDGSDNDGNDLGQKEEELEEEEEEEEDLEEELEEEEEQQQQEEEEIGKRDATAESKRATAL